MPRNINIGPLKKDQNKSCIYKDKNEQWMKLIVRNSAKHLLLRVLHWLKYHWDYPCQLALKYAYCMFCRPLRTFATLQKNNTKRSVGERVVHGRRPNCIWWSGWRNRKKQLDVLNYAYNTMSLQKLWERSLYLLRQKWINEMLISFKTLHQTYSREFYIGWSTTESSPVC